LVPMHATEVKTEPKKDTPSFAATVAAAQQPQTAGHGIVVNAANRVGVPSFVGEPLRVAVETAGTAGLALQIVGSGIAREQVPAPGSMVPPGTEIVVRFTR
jgi:cell division protein FtsI (penicillin-binding protein 3)